MTPADHAPSTEPVDGPDRDPAADAVVPAWAPPGRTVDLPGRGTTWARDSGADRGRPALLLLHGWGVTADLNFFTAYEALAEGHRVVALDHRGHGRGIRPAGGIVRLADCADDAAALLDRLGIERAVVLGYSMGGPIAQDLWHRHPDRVAGLVLCATARHFQGGPLVDLWYRSFGGLAHLAHRADGPARALLRRRIERRVGRDGHAEWMRTELLRSDPAGTLSAMASLGQFRSNAWIGEVDVPTAVIVHTRDRTVPPGSQRRLGRAVSHAEVIEVDGPHDAIVSRADRYLPALLEALDAVSPGR